MLLSRRIAGNREGVAGAVATIFILLIVLSFINIYIGAYVPSTMRTQEYNHMQEVYQEFSSFQLQNYNLESGHWKYPLTTTIVMGSSGSAPFASPTNGQISFSRSSFSVLVSLNYSLNSPTSENIRQHISAGGSLSLSVQNRYFTPQTVIYEGGAVIVNQTGVSLISEGPLFKVVNSSSQGMIVSFNLISLLGNNFSASGSGPASLSTSYFSNSSTLLRERSNMTIQIHTQFPEVWKSYFSSALSGIPKITTPPGKMDGYSIRVNGSTVVLTMYNIALLHLQVGTLQILLD